MEVLSQFMGRVATPKTQLEAERYLLLCHSLPMRRNSVWSGFSCSLFPDIHDWIEANHDLKLLSAGAE